MTISTISVVIPTHRRPAMLEEALASVHAQSLQAHEIIVIDDDTEHGRGKGGSGARNAGVLRATGDAVAFLDDDDLWPDTRIAEAAEALVGLATGAAWTCAPIEVHREGRPPAVFRAPVDTPRTSSWAVRRDVLLDEPFDERLAYGQDTELYARLLARLGPPAVTETPVIIRVGHPSITRRYMSGRNTPWRHIIGGSYGHH